MLKLLLHCYTQAGKSKIMDLHPDLLLKNKIEQPKPAPVLRWEAKRGWGLAFPMLKGKTGRKSPLRAARPGFGVLPNRPPNPQCRIRSTFGFSGASMRHWQKPLGWGMNPLAPSQGLGMLFPGGSGVFWGGNTQVAKKTKKRIVRKEI